ncbi:restriction endonuclease family protein [Lyngbya aestuarii BL J]|uniref:Restriction endonuclease family protein n=1 Tax=Lyngbya aestuarii BL J TaxID=1348334 RepID=U7QIH3_9CYAN|nr:Uma2 family endonuclease [Lyngbya aestuarii]ERT07693.1 restriction endonuclease family protein [Lyngbya aestuarii BL J]
MQFTKQRADRVVLYNISWQQFENLLIDLGDSRAARVAYNNGTLEIMTPLPEHEYFKQSISIAIEDIAEELDINYESYGSTTWKREARLAGIEPDNCFYFQNESLVRGKLQFDLNQDPPPDLALEIDLTSKSLNRFPIYARLGIPEIWCYEQGKLRIYQLESGQYQEVEQSSIFPMLSIHQLPELIESYRLEGRRALRRAVRQWVREQV